MALHAAASGQPRLDDDVMVAPGAIVSGDVRLGAGSVVLAGAVVTAQDGRIELGRDCVVMENAVVRATAQHPVRIGDRVLVGPTAYLAGCEVGDDVFLATGSRVFHGARIGDGAEVRVNGVVHLRSAVPLDTVVPIGWVAVGDPAELFSPDHHEAIWRIQEPLDFPGFVYGMPRDEIEGRLMSTLGPRYARYFRALLRATHEG
jgi:carbonic anhydrase/acetyltransferase-like protein (isoleucine patch superfamily)